MNETGKLLPMSSVRSVTYVAGCSGAGVVGHLDRLGVGIEAVGANAGLASVGYLDAMARLAAISISASSNTINGALPPSSIEVFLTVAAHCSISNLPT
jgi:hypothetical protein